ncbi:MAG: peptidoglycan-binding domain-containing protein [Actinomycetota bacterium]
MTRGEDVAELQRRLGRLGFDAGRIDGIFGPDTVGATEEFQRNAGLGIDGICGPATVDALDRFGRRLGDADPVAAVRERERLRTASDSLVDHRVALGETGGLAAPAAAIRRAMNDAGFRVLTIHHPDGSMHARQANAYDAELYVGLSTHDGDAALCYYEVPGYVSYGGRLLAQIGCTELASILPGPVEVRGMRLPVLRETRMPAVVCRLPLTAWSAALAPRLGRATMAAVSRWATVRRTSDAESEASTDPRVE